MVDFDATCVLNIILQKSYFTGGNTTTSVHSKQTSNFSIQCLLVAFALWNLHKWFFLGCLLLVMCWHTSFTAHCCMQQWTWKQLFSFYNVLVGLKKAQVTFLHTWYVYERAQKRRATWHNSMDMGMTWASAGMGTHGHGSSSVLFCMIVNRPLFMD